MPNDSSTGGFLTASSVNGDVNDNALIDFLQTVVVGITGLPGALVRPRWQPEPPNIPDPGTNWAAIGPDESRGRESYSYRQKVNAETTIVVRNRLIPILCSFYGPAAEANSELLAMGFEIPQNRETMQLAGFNLVGGVGSTVITPALIKTQWYPKADVPFTIRQQQKYTYAVLDLVRAQATLELQPPGQPIISETINVTAPPE
jgi:hypothetical protein